MCGYANMSTPGSHLAWSSAWMHGRITSQWEEIGFLSPSAVHQFCESPALLSRSLLSCLDLAGRQMTEAVEEGGETTLRSSMKSPGSTCKLVTNRASLALLRIPVFNVRPPLPGHASE